MSTPSAGSYRVWVEAASLGTAVNEFTPLTAVFDVAAADSPALNATLSLDDVLLSQSIPALFRVESPRDTVPRTAARHSEVPRATTSSNSVMEKASPPAGVTALVGDDLETDGSLDAEASDLLMGQLLAAGEWID